MYRVRAGDNARIKEEISVCIIRNTQMMRRIDEFPKLVRSEKAKSSLQKERLTNDVR